MKTEEMIFHRGLLYALSEKRRQIHADGVRFHEAYGEALRVALASEDKVAQEAIQYFDPVYGVYTYAESMLSHGMFSFLIHYAGRAFTTACFTLKAETATKELADMLAGHPGRIEMFRRMADAFLAHIERSEHEGQG